MKFLTYEQDGMQGLAIDADAGFVGLTSDEAGFPGDLMTLLKSGGDALARAGEVLRKQGRPVDLAEVRILPPVMPGKILCVGLNYANHAAESDMKVPEVPTLFSRFASTVVGAKDAIRLPRVSTMLDYEGELAVVIGKAGRYIDKADALAHVAGYSVFNDATLRDYQLRTPQWTIGKNFDGTGPFGPVMVTADALPAGGAGLKIETRLAGKVMQSASTDDLIFDVATLIAGISEALTLEPGDVIITGTPAGVGGARKPQRWMVAGEICEVEIESIGMIQNAIVADA